MSRNHAIALLGTSLAVTGSVIWLLGATPSEPSEALALLTGSIALPTWALFVLSLFPGWIATSLVRSLVQRLRTRRFRAGGVHTAAQEVELPTPAAALTPELPEPQQPIVPEAAPTPPTAPVRAPAPAMEDYHEDAVFGVVWRWFDDPLTAELLACCPACNDALIPLSNGGSLSRGLHCERCNKLRAAGEHPSEVYQKVADTLAQRARSGEWRGAPVRVERARTMVTRPLSELPAA